VVPPEWHFNSINHYEWDEKTKSLICQGIARDIRRRGTVKFGKRLCDWDITAGSSCKVIRSSSALRSASIIRDNENMMKAKNPDVGFKVVSAVVEFQTTGERSEVFRYQAIVTFQAEYLPPTVAQIYELTRYGKYQACWQEYLGMMERQKWAERPHPAFCKCRLGESFSGVTGEFAFAEDLG